MRRGLALALVALLALPPLALAEPPVAESWSPYDTIAPVNAIAFSDAGSTLAAAVATLPGEGTTCPGGTCLPGQQAANTSTPDMVVLQTDRGFAFAGTGSSLATGGVSAKPLGRTLVAVSRDGHAIASVGIDTKQTPSPPVPGAAPSTTTLKLYVDSVPVGANVSAGTVTSRFLEIPGNSSAGLAISDDGSRVVVLVTEEPNLKLEGYTVAGSTLQPAFTTSIPGSAVALAASSGLDRIFAAGNLKHGNDTLPGVALVPFGAGSPTATYYDQGNGTAATAIATVPDGSSVALGTAAGRLVVLDGASLALGGEFLVTASASRIAPIAFAADARHLAAASAGTLSLLNVSARQPSLAWSRTIDASFNALDFNASGAILVTSANGTAGSVSAYGLGSATPFWTIAGDARGAQVNANGTEIAYYQPHVVHAQKLPRAFSLEYPGGLKTGATRGLRAGGSTAFDLVVRNAGAAPERVTFRPASDPLLAVALEPALVDVAPGESMHVSALVTASPRFAGERSIRLDADALGAGLTDNVTLGVSFEGVANVTFQVNQTEYLVTPGLPTSVLLTVLNNGTTSASVGLRTSQQVSAGPAWGLDVDQPSFLVPQGSITTVRATVTPPASTPNGTNDAITFTLEGPNVSDTVVLNFRVNPHLGVDLQATGRVKFVEPGKFASFNVTVVNNGSLTRDFLAFYDVSSANGRPWSVEMSTEPFRLAPGETRTLPIKVFAPADAKADEHVSILVRARSVPVGNESFVEANVTLFATAQEPLPTSSTPSGNAIPFPSLLVAAACLALAALARRRRSP